MVLEHVYDDSVETTDKAQLRALCQLSVDSKQRIIESIRALITRYPHDSVPARHLAEQLAHEEAELRYWLGQIERV